MEAIERPVLRVVVVGELGPEQAYRFGGRAPRGVEAVDKEGLDEVMGRFVGTLRLRVANRIAAAPREVEVVLPVTGLKSFRPEAVAEAIPLIADLARLRGLVGELSTRRLTVEQFQSRAEEAIGDGALLAEVRRAFGAAAPAATPSPSRPAQGPGPPPSGAAGVDAILGMVDLPSGVEAGEASPAVPGAGPPPSPLDEVLRQITRNRQRAADPAVAREVAADLDRRIAAQLDEVFCHSVFRRLEAVWRGIAFLVRRADLREPIRIECLHAPPEAVIETLRTEVVEPAVHGEVAVAPGLIVVDHACDATVPSLETLEALAEIGDEVQAPVVANLAHAFFQVEDAAGFNAIPSLDLHLAGDGFIKWRALRGKEATRWLVVAYNRFALRAPYGDEQSPTRGFAYREGRGLEALWGNPGWLVATAACRSFADTGWAGRLDGEIGDLSLIGPEDRAMAAEAAIGPDRLATLADHGIVGVAGHPGRDTVHLVGLPTAHLPARTPDEAANSLARARAALGSQMVVAQLARLLYDLVPLCGADRPDTAVAEAVTRRLRALFGVQTGDEAVQVEVGPHPDRVDRRLLHIHVRPPAAVLASRAPVEMALPIPG